MIVCSKPKSALNPEQRMNTTEGGNYLFLAEMFILSWLFKDSSLPPSLSPSFSVSVSYPAPAQEPPSQEKKQTYLISVIILFLYNQLKCKINQINSFPDVGNQNQYMSLDPVFKCWGGGDHFHALIETGNETETLVFVNPQLMCECSSFILIAELCSSQPSLF